MPSIVYLIKNGTINGYNGQNHYFLNENTNVPVGIETAIFGVILVGIFIIYFKLIKNSDKFKNFKEILISAIIIGFIFLICLPNTSTDVFYYMGTGRILSEYDANPYYQTIEEIDNNVNDEILSNVHVWRDTKVVYGPLWVIIIFLLNKLSFGSITLLLYIFKFSTLLLHIGCCVLVYKLTKRKKFAVIYAFNPLMLLEFLINCHNDIYMIFFALLAIYFVKNEKNIWTGLVALTFSTSIKYITVIVFPFLVLYHLKDKKILDKIKWGLLYTVVFLIFNVIMYIPWFANVSDAFKGIFGQQDKLMNSIHLFISYAFNNYKVSAYICSVAIYVAIYIAIVNILMLLTKKVTIKRTMTGIYEILYVVIFGMLTTLTAWYLAWVFIPLFWTKAKNIKNTLWVQFFFELTNVGLLYVHSDSFIYNRWIVPFIILGMLIRAIILLIKRWRKYDKEKRRICC